jgi:hypothetical protein
MEKTIILENGLHLTYVESFWKQSKKIFINGKETRKISKTEFVYGEDNENLITVKGNQYKGISVNANGKDYEICPKMPWYVYLLFVAPVLFIIIFGSIPSLVEIFPVVGGLIGGLISCAISCVGLSMYYKISNKKVALLVQFCFALLSVFACYLVGLAIISAVPK